MTKSDEPFLEIVNQNFLLMENWTIYEFILTSNDKKSWNIFPIIYYWHFDDNNNQSVVICTIRVTESSQSF